MIEDRVTATVEAALYQPRSLRHFISGVRIVGEDGGEVRTEANFLIIESLVEREPRLLMVGRYLDRVVREDEALKFRERTCVFDNYRIQRSEEHTSELQSLMSISYAVFCLKKKIKN